MKKKINEVIRKLGVKKNDNIFLHSDLSLLKKYKNKKDIDRTCENLLCAILETIGKKGTLAVPTFSYSFCNKKNYHPKKTVSNCGYFSEYIRNHSLSKTYPDPNVSVSVIGHKKNYLTKKVTLNSYGKGSFFDNFYKLKCKIMNINMDAGSTFVHFFEKKLKVYYRKDIKFSGYIEGKNKRERQSFLLFSRKKKNNYFANFERLNEIAIKKKIFKTYKLGFGFIGIMKIESLKKLITKNYKTNKNFLIYLK